jgi:hypothetical protein
MLQRARWPVSVLPRWFRFSRGDARIDVGHALNSTSSFTRLTSVASTKPMCLRPGRCSTPRGLPLRPSVPDRLRCDRHSAVEYVPPLAGGAAPHRVSGSRPPAIDRWVVAPPIKLWYATDEPGEMWSVKLGLVKEVFNVESTDRYRYQWFRRSGLRAQGSCDNHSPMFSGDGYGGEDDENVSCA